MGFNSGFKGLTVLYRVMVTGVCETSFLNCSWLHWGKGRTTYSAAITEFSFTK